MAHKLKHHLEYGAFQALFQFTRLLPRRALLAAGRGIGSFVWKVAGFRKNVIVDNLTHAFGHEKDDAWIQNTAHQFYRNLGMTLMEFLASGNRSSEDLRKDIKVEGMANVQEVLDLNKGALFMSGHFGNFEILLPRAALEGLVVNGVVKPQSNKLIEKFQDNLRQREGVGIIKTGGSFPAIQKSLKNGEFVAMLGDQDAGPKGQFVEFLGRPASVTRGPATLAVNAGVPILMVFLYRQPDFSHVLKIEPMLKVDPQWDEKEAVRRLTEMHTAKLEEAVRNNPQMYYWVHRRWKTRPSKCPTT
ncbi:MAG: lysophospholipid acyltransferase family protein [bacterium]|nr:lysophospholipid acyltransferase family protein [bacterium]